MEPNNNDRLLEQFKIINSDYNKIIKKNELNDFNWNEKIKNIKKDNEKFKKDNELLKKENEDKNKEINELKNKLKENELLKKENEDKNNEINELKGKLKENELLKKENEDKNREINELKDKLKENESLKKENEKFKKDNESLKKYEDKNNINNNLNISDQTNYNLLISSSSDPLNLYNNNTSSSNFNDSKMNDYKNVTPNYSCYINSDNDLVIEIELVGFKNCKLSYEIINNEFYNFHIIAEKENDEIEKKMILNKRINENIDYIFKIPIDSFTLSESKPYFKKFEKGLITFKYKLLNNSSSISIKFNDINIPKSE